MPDYGGKGGFQGKGGNPGGWGGSGGGGGGWKSTPAGPHHGMKSKKQLEREREQRMMGGARPGQGTTAGQGGLGGGDRPTGTGGQSPGPGPGGQMIAGATPPGVGQSVAQGGTTAGFAGQGGGGGQSLQNLFAQQAADALAAQQAAEQQAADALAAQQAAEAAEEEAREEFIRQQYSLAVDQAYGDAETEMGGARPGAGTSAEGILSALLNIKKNQIIDANPNIFGPDASYDDFTVVRDEFGNDIMYSSDMTQRIGSIGEVGDLPGWLGTGAGMLFGPDTLTFTADPSITRDAERGPGNQGQGNPAGLSPGYYAQIQAQAAEQAAAQAQAAAAAEADTQAEQEEVLTSFAPQYTTSPATSGIATVPATGNYMDYMQYAFRPVNLADPFGGSPTQTITGYNPLFADNPVYAADGGRIGKMHGGMMIMGDEGVVNNGIGGILSKYKEIRSEL